MPQRRESFAMQTAEETQPAPGSFRELWQVALPLVLSSGSLSLMFVIDRVFLTWYSTDALAAAVPAGLLHWTVISVLIGTVLYVNTFVAQYDGAQRKDRVVASVWQGIYLSLTAALSLLLVVPFASSIFELVGHAPPVQKMETQYFSILCMGAAPITLATAMSCFYSGRGKTQTVMCVNFAAVAVNIGLDYGLIFGKGPLPGMGIRGAALATVASQVTSVLIYSVLFYRAREKAGYRIFKYRGFDRELFGRLIRYGLPTGLQFLADIAGFALFIFLVGKIGTTELAATNLAFNLNSMAFIPMFGLGTAVMTLVGRRIGEGRPDIAVRTTWLGFAAVGVYMFAFAGVYLFLPDVILYPYAAGSSAAEFAPIRAQVITLLRFVALFSFFDGMAIVFSSAVRGAGDTRFSLVFTFLTGWLLMVLPTVVAWRAFGGSLVVSWGACTTYIVVLGIGFMIRFQSGKWMSMRVIEQTAADVAMPTEPLPERRVASREPAVDLAPALLSRQSTRNGSEAGASDVPCE